MERLTKTYSDGTHGAADNLPCGENSYTYKNRGYNKAIDDAKSVILRTIDNEILVDTLHLRLEQLKERNNE